MSEADIDKAVKEAAEFEAQDKKRKEGIDARNDADAIVFQTEKAMEEVGSSLDPAMKSEVEADIASLKSVVEATANATDLTDSQIQQLKDGKEKLMKSAQALFAKMYENAQGAQGGPQAGPGPDMNAGAGNGGADDDVVDADFKEV